jgi:hypothetical protein
MKKVSIQYVGFMIRGYVKLNGITAAYMARHITAAVNYNDGRLKLHPSCYLRGTKIIFLVGWTLSG